MDVEYQAAWVPFNDSDLDLPAALAVEWVERECAEQNAGGLVVTPMATIDGHVESIRAFAAKHGHTSARGGRPRRSGGGPVIAYRPDLRDLEFAAGRARGSSLCAVEHPTLRLVGWAAARGAVNLATGEAPVPFDAAVTTLLEYLVFAGNNGWFDAPGKRDARRILGELRTLAPSLDADFLAGYVLGKGQSADASKHLHAMAGKAAV
jgi:hypothetical protein